MSKKKIANDLSHKLGFSNKKSLKLIDMLINLIKTNSSKYRIKIHNFGTFYMHKSPTRLGRNPITKESYIIGSRKKLSFKASYKTKKILN
tara:strand:+ start:8759 stop:9028 length:270 start_codon:yes stop_codon:yes gene_type:complete